MRIEPATIPVLVEEARVLYLALKVGLKRGGIYDSSPARYQRVCRIQRAAQARYLRRIALGFRGLYTRLYPETPAAAAPRPLVRLPVSASG